MSPCIMLLSTVIAILLLSSWKVDAFVVSKGTLEVKRKLSRTRFRARQLSATTNHNHDDQDDTNTPSSSRRDFFTSLSTLTLPLVVSQPSLAEEKDRVLVLGGTGFVGSQVVKILSERNIETIATCRNGRDETVALDFVNDDNIEKKVERLASGCTAVISCIGAIGTKDDEKVNAGTGVAAVGAKATGTVQRFVYITVAPEVKEFARDIDFLQGYMAGKTSSRNAVLQSFQNDAVLIEPTFIYGGGSFELNPPRVASFYGQFVEGILSSSPIRNVERLLSPGFLKIALEPPVPVEDVANAAVAGALGKTTLNILDSYDKIKQASSQLS